MSVNIVVFDSSLIPKQSANARGSPEDTYAVNTHQISQMHAAVPSMHCMQLLPISLLLTAGETQCQVCDMVVNAMRTSSLMENKMQCNLTGFKN